jgi:hypothetical protein
LTVGLIIYYSNDFVAEKLLSFDFSPGSSLYRRYHLYLGGLQSVFYNYGTGFGIGGYHYYYAEVLDSSRLWTDTDPHNYFIELLINSGVYITIAYVLISTAIFYALVKAKGDKLLIVQFVLYHILLLSSSSSLFLWPHYLFYFVYVFYPIKKRS